MYAMFDLLHIVRNIQRAIDTNHSRMNGALLEATNHSDSVHLPAKIIWKYIPVKLTSKIFTNLLVVGCTLLTLSFSLSLFQSVFRLSYRKGKNVFFHLHTHISNIRKVFFLRLVVRFVFHFHWLIRCGILSFRDVLQNPICYAWKLVSCVISMDESQQCSKIVVGVVFLLWKNMTKSYIAFIKHILIVCCVCVWVCIIMYSGLVENSVCDRRISFAIASAYENHTFLDKVFVHLICIYSNRDRENKGEKKSRERERTMILSPT